MTPERIDVATVQRRLRLIDDALVSLRSLSDVDEARLAAEPLTRAAAERLIQVVVDLAFDVNGHLAVARLGRAPETGRQSFLDLATIGVLEAELADALAPCAGLRNVLIHHYVEVRLDIVAAAVGTVLDLFPDYVRAVARHLTDT